MLAYLRQDGTPGSPRDHALGVERLLFQTDARDFFVRRICVTSGAERRKMTAALVLVGLVQNVSQA